MLTLALLRHAKSSWDHPSLDDFARPLAERGQQAAPAMGAHIEQLGLTIDHVLCSGAVRTRQTLALVMPHLSQPAPTVTFEDTLYLASASELLTRLKRVSARKACVLMVGHNPGFHDFATILAKPQVDDNVRALTSKFPTAALAVLTFDVVSWSKIAPAGGTLTHFMTPKHLEKLSVTG